MSGIRVSALSSKGNTIIREVMALGTEKDDNLAGRIFDERIEGEDPYVISLKFKKKVFGLVMSSEKVAHLVTENLERLGGINQVDFLVVII